MASRGRITIEIDKTTKSQLQAVLKDKLSKISSYTDDVLPVQPSFSSFFSSVKQIKFNQEFIGLLTTYTGRVHAMASQRVMITGVRAGDGG